MKNQEQSLENPNQGQSRRLAVNFVRTHPWAILPEYLQVIMDAAERKIEFPWEGDEPESIMRTEVQKSEGCYYSYNVNGVGVVDVKGPLFRYANLFTRYSGASSTELLAKDFTRMLHDPNVKAIVLNINSPGGQADGISEFAEMVRRGRKNKPIYAYVSGYGASAAYWIATAASKVIVNDSAIVGSIGVYLALENSKNPEIVEFVSSTSPNKRPNLDKPEGRARVQRMVDSLAEVFISAVAKNRGVTADKVLSDFGQGDVMVGRLAVDAGMADDIGSLESTLIRAANMAMYSTEMSPYLSEQENLDSDAPQNENSGKVILSNAVTAVTEEVNHMSLTKEDLQSMLDAQAEKIRAEVKAEMKAEFETERAAETKKLQDEKKALVKSQLQAIVDAGQLTPAQLDLNMKALESADFKPEVVDSVLAAAKASANHGLLKEQAATGDEQPYSGQAAKPVVDVAKMDIPAGVIPLSYVHDQIANGLISKAASEGRDLKYADAVRLAAKTPEYQAAEKKYGNLSPMSADK